MLLATLSLIGYVIQQILETKYEMILSKRSNSCLFSAADLYLSSAKSKKNSSFIMMAKAARLRGLRFAVSPLKCH